MADIDPAAPTAAVPTGALGLHRALPTFEEVASFGTRDHRLVALVGNESLWLSIDQRYLLRTAYGLGGITVDSHRLRKDGATFRCSTAFGKQVVEVGLSNGVVSARTTLTPHADLLLHYWPRDFFPVDSQRDPLGARGKVEAAQRGYNAAVCYVCRSDGAGAALYFQNLTALNAFFNATKTTPDGVVGGRWPELGYQPPTAPQFEKADDNPLKAGEKIIVSDARVALSDTQVSDERVSARTFLDLLAAVYRTIDHPVLETRDWPAMAKRTQRDLRSDPRVTVEHYGHRYVKPYIGYGQPDSMVQLAVARPMTLLKQSRDDAETLITGMPKFFDRKLGTIRRFLPNVVKQSKAEGDEKDPDEVDSWYLYHPLTNLGTLALGGHELAKRLFLDALDFAIKVARHFDYDWPILFDVTTLEVKTATRKDGDPGQSDVAGIYAEVMVKAWELTQEQRFLDEAQAALKAAKGLRFDLNYQTNLTAKGLMPCIKLWRITGDRYFLDEAFVFLASFLHNTIFWESEIGTASHYKTFLGATCLHDGPYMAIFECFESFEAFRDFLTEGGEDLPESVRILCEAYCAGALDRAWFFYPSELPEDVVSDEVRSGELDAKLAIPLEDIYADGQQVGQVGQEVYGSGATFAFAAHMLSANANQSQT